MSDLLQPLLSEPKEHAITRNKADDREESYVDSSACRGLLTDEEKQGHEADSVLADKEVDIESAQNKFSLFISIIIMVGSGVINVIYGKLQMIPMYNYPSFLSGYESIIFVPMVYAIFLPMHYMGRIPADQFKLSKWPFALMGFLDGLTCLMQVFASDYISGPLMALIPQASIPISMILSKIMLKKNYNIGQILGSMVVILGIVVALGPELTNHRGSDHLCLPIHGDDECTVCHGELLESGCVSHLFHNTLKQNNDSFNSIVNNNNNNDAFGSVGTNDTSSKDQSTLLCMWEESTHSNSGAMSTLFWSAIMAISCIPLSISNIYKEREIEKRKLDPVYMSLWVAIFQSIFTILLIFPAGLLSSPSVSPSTLVQNFYNGFMCYIGHDRITTGCHPDQCADSMLFVNVFLIISLVVSIASIYVLKFGSANIMFIACTLIVPASNLAFSLPFVPQSIPMNMGNIWGLITIMLGIALFRFGSKLPGMICTTSLT